MLAFFSRERHQSRTDELLTRVDNLMYQAKNGGRSRLACDPELSAAS
jgi:PleD family two-component response regulator